VVKMPESKWVYGSIIGYFIAALFNAILVVLKESNESVHDWIAGTFGHHWVGHGILVLIVFIIFTLIGSAVGGGENLSETKSNTLILVAVAATIISVLIIGGFMIMHFFS